MMVTSTAIRLGTTGGNEVKSELRDIGATGTKAYDDVALAAERGARRAQKAYDQALKDGEEVRQRIARTSSTLETFLPKTNVQAAVQAGASSGFDQYGSSARASAAAIKELVAEQAAFERRAKLIREMLDPAAAAQARYTQEVRSTKDVLRAGAISVEDYIARIKQLQAAHRSVDGALGTTNANMGRLRAGSAQLSYQISDVANSFAVGTNPMIIFAQQGSQVVQAISLMQGEAKGFMGFMGGPWGAVLLGAVSILGLLIPKLLSGGEAQKEAAEAAKKHRAAIDELVRAQNQAITTEERKQALDVARIKLDLDAELAIRKKTQALLESTQASIQNAESNPSALPGEGGQVGLGLLDQDLDAIKGQMAANSARIAELTRGVDSGLGRMIQQRAESNATPEGRLERDFKRKQAALLDRSDMRGEANVKRLAAAEAELLKWRAAQLKLIEDANRNRNSSANRETGRSLNSREARSIAERAGFQVNSADRTFAQQKRLYDQWVAAGRPSDNPVAKPGSSAHEKGNALDIQFGVGVNPAALRKLYADQGVQLTKVFKERGHYHIEWAKDVAAAKGLADALREAAAAQRELDGAFDAVIGKLDPMTAKMHAYGDILDKITALQKGGRITAAMADELNRSAQLQFINGKSGQFGETKSDRPNDGELISTEQINANLERLDSLRKPIGEIKGAFADLESAGMSALDALLDPRGWQDFGETAKRVIREIILELVKLELKKAAVSLITKAFGGGKTPGFATGTSYAPAGLALVGEQGRELVDLPRGSRVYGASDTRRMLSGGNDNSAKFSFHWSIDATGADAAGLARVENQLRRLEQSVPSMAIAAVSDARQRRVGG
jgi:hypothetical protein